MISVLQRVSSGSCTVELQNIAVVGMGLVVFLCVCRGDTEDDARWMARKVANLRIFKDSQSKLNRSALDVRGQILVVPQFTLCGDCRRGYRPGFSNAADHSLARRLLLRVVELLRWHGLDVVEGIFGAYMQIELVNEGPVTLILDSKKVEYCLGERNRGEASGGRSNG